MSISNQTTQVGPYTISGSPQVLSVTFPFQAAADLVVYDLGASGVNASAPTILSLNSDYTVTGGGYDGANNMQSGSITVVSTGVHAVATGHQISIVRAPAGTQTTNFQTTGILTVPMIERALDKLTTGWQSFLDMWNGLPLMKSARASKLAGFDASGLPLLYPISTPVFISGSQVSAQTVALMKVPSYSAVPDKTPILLDGYFSPGDGGGGQLYVDKSDTSTADNGVTVFVANDGTRIKRTNPKDISVLKAGAKGDGSTDDTTAFHAAMDVFGGDGGTVVVPPGRYKANVVMRGNVRLVFQRTGYRTPVTNYITAFDTTKPAIKFGNGSTIVTGASVENAYVWGNNACDIGVQFKGCTEVYLTHCTVGRFKKSIDIVPDTANPSANIYVTECTVFSRDTGVASTDRAVSLQNSTSWPTTYVTACYFTNCHIMGATDGYALETDAVEVYLNNTYLDGNGSHLVKLTKSGGMVTNPRLNLINSNLDSPSNDSVSIVGFDNSPLWTYVDKYGSSVGKYKHLDGTVIASDGTYTLARSPAITRPYIAGANLLSDTANSDASYENAGKDGVTKTVTADAGLDTLNATAHGFVDNDRVLIASSGTLPGGLFASIAYYVVSATANAFKVSRSRGGSAINITSTGTGTITAQFTFPVQYYNSNGLFLVDAADGTKHISRLGGVHQFVGQPDSGYTYLRLVDELNGKNHDIYAANGNLFMMAGTGGAVYLQDPSGNNVGGGSAAGLFAGSSAYNGPHLLIGAYHFWVDSSGRLRIKNGAPSSDTDGTIVGTQT